MNTTGDGGSIGATDGATDDAADELLSRARVEDAARRRRRARWLAERRLEEATVVGALLGAGSTPVTLHLAGASTVRGTVTLLGDDLVELDSSGTRAVVPLAAVAAAETAGPLVGEPGDRSATTFAELLDELLHGGIEVGIGLRTGTTVRGRVVGVGDALVLRSSAPERSIVVPLEQIALALWSRC